MDSEVTAALVAAGAATLTAIVLAVLNLRETQRQGQRVSALEERRSELERITAAEKAKLDYEYDARRRLYTQFEPQLFQLLELAEYAQDRIKNLADPQSWRDFAVGEEYRPDSNRPPMAGDNYATVSTVYGLFAPLVIIRFMSRGLTLLDLSLDPRIELQYYLAKQVFGSVKDDSKLASLEPTINYSPFTRGWRHLREQDPGKYWWQGLTMGRLEMVLDLMTTTGHGSSERLMSFGEFEHRYQDIHASGNEIERKTLAAATNPIYKFRSRDRPVYCRMLVVQARLYRALTKTRTPGFRPPTDYGSWDDLLCADEVDYIFGHHEEATSQHRSGFLVATDAYLRERTVEPWVVSRRT